MKPQTIPRLSYNSLQQWFLDHQRDQLLALASQSASLKEREALHRQSFHILASRFAKSGILLEESK